MATQMPPICWWVGSSFFTPLTHLRDVEHEHPTERACSLKCSRLSAAVYYTLHLDQHLRDVPRLFSLPWLAGIKVFVCLFAYLQLEYDILFYLLAHS